MIESAQIKRGEESIRSEGDRKGEGRERPETIWAHHEEEEEIQTGKCGPVRDLQILKIY